MHFVAGLVVLLAMAPLTPAEVGQFLTAGARVRSEWVGTTVTLKLALPAHCEGREVEVPTREQAARRSRSRLEHYGQAYAPEDTAVVSNLIVTRDRIEVWFRSGGACDTESGAGPQLPATVMPVTRTEFVNMPFGLVRIERRVNSEGTEAGRRIEASDRYDRERSERAERAYAALAQYGSRLVLSYPKGVPLADICVDSLIVRLADAVTFEPHR